MTIDAPVRAEHSPTPAIALSSDRPRSWIGEVVAWVPTVGVLMLLVAGWEVAARWLNVPVFLLPSPSAIAERLLARLDYFAANTVVTLLQALGGFVVGSSVAFGLAAVMVFSRAAERALYPVALLVKVTPIVAVAPLFVIWFGFGPTPKVIIAALITFFPVLVNALAGLRAVNPNALEFLRSVGASRWERFWLLRLPSSLPYLFAAGRVAAPLSLVGAVVGEWWGASSGLGRIIFLANAQVDMPMLFGAVVVLAALGVAATGAISLAERVWLRWHESQRGVE